MDIFTEKLYGFLKDKIKANQEENKMEKTEWVWGHNEEVFNSINIYPTKEEAIAAGKEECKEEGDTYFFVGETEQVNLKVDVDVDRILEMASEYVYEEVGEAAEDYLTHVKDEHFRELQSHLNATLKHWMCKYDYLPNFFKVNNIVKVEVN
jgi:hypothetical protein